MVMKKVKDTKKNEKKDYQNISKKQKNNEKTRYRYILTLFVDY